MSSAVEVLTGSELDELLEVVHPRDIAGLEELGHALVGGVRYRIWRREEQTEASASSTTMSESLSGLERPPDLRVNGGGADLVVAPYSYCWVVDGQGLCADGAPQEPLPTLTLDDTSQLSLWFPLDWQLSATLLAGGEYCNGAMVIDVDPQGSPLRSLGPAGTYRVDVFGRGEGGDGAWAFELVTSNDRPSAPPYVQVLWFPSDRELETDAPFYALVGNISVPPLEVAATAVVTDSNGGSVELGLSVADDGGCWSSSIGFEGPASFTARVLDLGPPPYAAVVTVAMDGTTITGAPLRWPDDFPANSNESPLTSATVDITVSPIEGEDQAPVWPPTEPGEAVSCAYQYPDDLAAMPLAFDGTIVGAQRGKHVEEAAATPVDLEIQVNRVFKGGLGDTVTMHTWDFSAPHSSDPWDPTGIRILAAASETLDVMFCGFTRPYTSGDAELWNTLFNR